MNSLLAEIVEKQPFFGRCISSEACELGEGPTFDPSTGIAWWFDIKGRCLHNWHAETGRAEAHALPFLGSALGRIDVDRQLIVADSGLFIRFVSTGELVPYLVVENDPATRSNDSRVHPSGSLWTSRMGRNAEKGCGSIYHVSSAGVRLLYRGMTIPNGICFSPDGAMAYFADSRINQFMKVSLDPLSGLPTGEPAVLVDETGSPGCIDGAVCDADGRIWSARWGDGSIDVHRPDGVKIARYAVPATQVSCPAFIGSKFDRLLVTTAWEDMDAARRNADPSAGCTFELGVAVHGRPEPDFKL